MWDKRGSAQLFTPKAFIFSNLKVARVNSIKRDMPCKDPFFIPGASKPLLILLTLDRLYAGEILFLGSKHREEGRREGLKIR